MADFIQKYHSALFIIFLAVIVGLSFYLGYEQGRTTGPSDGGIVFSCPNTILDTQKIPLSASVSSNQDTRGEQVTTTTSETSGAYVGSKNGTKYYTPGCSGSKRIKPENYVWFQTVQDATLQGYTKGSC